MISTSRRSLCQALVVPACWPATLALAADKRLHVVILLSSFEAHSIALPELGSRQFGGQRSGDASCISHYLIDSSLHSILLGYSTFSLNKCFGTGGHGVSFWRISMLPIPGGGRRTRHRFSGAVYNRRC